MGDKARLGGRRGHGGSGSGNAGGSWNAGTGGHSSSNSDAKSDLSNKISDLRSRASRFQGSALFSEEAKEISTLEKKFDDGLRKLENLRGRGYVYGVSIEESLKHCKELWADRKIDAESELRRLSDEVRHKCENVDREVRELRNIFERDFRQAEGRYRDVENRVSEFQRFVDTAKNRIEAKFEDLKKDLQKAEYQLKEIEDSFNLLEKSGFNLHQGEDLIYVCGGQYLEDRKKNGPKGNIFLTGNRFVFEQNEEVVVSRRLLFFTKKEHVQKIITERPIGALSEIKDLEQGFVFKAEILDVTFQDGKAPNDMMLKLNKDSTMLKDLINRILSGDIDRDKVGARTPTGALGEGPALSGTEELATAPAPQTGPQKELKCPGCGALYDKPLLKGMTSDNCGYCGALIRF